MPARLGQGHRLHVSRNKDALDDFVTRLVVGFLSGPKAAGLLVANRNPDAVKAADDVAALQARLDNAADMFAAGDIDRRRFERVAAKLRPEILAAEARDRIVDDSHLFAGVVGAADVAAAWEALSLSRRRAIVDALIQIRVLPSRTGRGVFDPKAVDITWRT